MITEIQAYIIAAIPALTAVATILVTAYRILGNFRSLVKRVDDKTDLSEARTEMQQLINENKELRREVADLITEISKVKYNDKTL